MAPTIPAWMRVAFALPNRLYEHDLGWLLGHRFLRLTHWGRTSGREYHTVLEVVDYDPGTGEAVVAAGFGRRSDWFRNVTTTGRAEVTIARTRRPVAPRVLPEDEAVAVMAGYEERNRLAGPVVRRTLSWLLGWAYDGSDEARKRLVQQLPLVAFRPLD